MPLEEITMSQMPQKNVSLAELKARTAALPPDTPLGFFSAGGLDLMQRAAMMLANSTLVPASYRAKNVKRNQYGSVISEEENPNAISNCVLALNMAQRMHADPLMIMQNLFIVEGRPAWSSQFIIACINACGKFSPLRFELVSKGEKDVEWEETKWEDRQKIKIPRTEHINDVECVAWAIEKSTGEKLCSPPVSIEMAIKETWYGKNGSKWKTMPETMLRYRAASFFGKLYAPELLMGIASAEEMQDTIDLTPQADGSFARQEEAQAAPSMTTADIAALTVPSAAEAVDVTPAAEPETPPAAPAGDPAEDAAKETAARKKTRKTDTASAGGTAAPEAPAAAPSATQDMPTIPCPRRDGGLVSTDDCFYCQERKGCPAREEPHGVFILETR